MQWAHKKDGFTIVELLIVIVVIAILAAITIVSYNGISQRAKVTVAQDSLKTAQTQLATHAIQNADLFPTDLSSLGLSNSNGVTYQYSVNNSTNPPGYCVTATLNGISYYIGSNFTYNGTSGPTTLNQTSSSEGACPGHTKASGPDPAPIATMISNASRNPSAETNLFTYGYANGATGNYSTTRAYHGSASLLVTLPASANAGTSGTSIFQEDPFTSLQPNTTYTASAYVYVPAATNSVRVAVQGSGISSVGNGAESFLGTQRDQWVRIWNVFTTNSTGKVTVFILNRYTTVASTTQFWADGFMITEGSTPPTYADGNSPGWSWSGTVNNSTSTGPQL